MKSTGSVQLEIRVIAPAGVTTMGQPKFAVQHVAVGGMLDPSAVGGVVMWGACWIPQRWVVE